MFLHGPCYCFHGRWFDLYIHSHDFQRRVIKCCVLRWLSRHVNRCKRLIFRIISNNISAYLRKVGCLGDCFTYNLFLTLWEFKQAGTSLAFDVKPRRLLRRLIYLTDCLHFRVHLGSCSKFYRFCFCFYLLSCLSHNDEVAAHCAIRSFTLILVTFDITS